MKITKLYECPCCNLRPSVYESFDSLYVICHHCGLHTNQSLWDGCEDTKIWEQRTIDEWNEKVRKVNGKV